MLVEESALKCGDFQERLPEDGSWEKERDAAAYTHRVKSRLDFFIVVVGLLGTPLPGVTPFPLSLAQLQTCGGFTILAIKPRSYPDLAKRRLRCPRKRAMGITQYSNTGGRPRTHRDHSAWRTRAVAAGTRAQSTAAVGGGTAPAPTLIRLLTPPPLLLLGRADTAGWGDRRRRRRGAAVSASHTLPPDDPFQAKSAVLDMSCQKIGAEEDG
ncbi:hypothetical protein EDB85DRAFT_1897250 [Lactarius pseudohatsudake]|nr:hypothetical protein EDB85DRAFT_1897250 [Lactarius pseudohatsudake]